MNNEESYFVAAKPVWDLVRKRQRDWGYTDDEMAAFLDLGGVIDVRGWMGRPMAERLLRRLTRPARPNLAPSPSSVPSPSWKGPGAPTPPPGSRQAKPPKPPEFPPPDLLRPTCERATGNVGIPSGATGAGPALRPGPPHDVSLFTSLTWPRRASPVANQVEGGDAMSLWTRTPAPPNGRARRSFWVSRALRCSPGLRSSRPQGDGLRPPLTAHRPPPWLRHPPRGFQPPGGRGPTGAGPGREVVPGDASMTAG